MSDKLHDNWLYLTNIGVFKFGGGADRLAMVLDDLDRKEKTLFFSSLVLVGLVLGASVLHYLNPPVQVLEAKVFDVYVSDGSTFILTYGEGKLRLNGEYNIELDQTYRITYQSRARNVASIVLSVEKIS